MRHAAWLPLLAPLTLSCGKQEATGATVAAPAEESGAPDVAASSGALAAEGGIAAASDAAVDLEEEIAKATIGAVLQPSVSITVRPQWRACEEADECTSVASPCSADAVVVNEASREVARAAWAEACGDRTGKQGAFVEVPQYVCIDGMCGTTGLGAPGDVEGAGGGTADDGE